MLDGLVTFVKKAGYVQPLPVPRADCGTGMGAYQAAMAPALGLDARDLNCSTLLEVSDVKIENLLAALIELDLPQAVVGG